MLRNTAKTFGSLTKLFHWLLAFLILAQFYLVWGKNFFPKGSPIRIEYMFLHKSFGVTVLILGILFLIWRGMNEKPLPKKSQPRWKRISAKAVHHTLLVLMILMPIFGYLMLCADGRTVSFFGLFNLPNLISENQNLSTIFFQTHQKLGFLLLFLIGIHVLAALHHHFILKDGVLIRMLPFNKPKKSD